MLFTHDGFAQGLGCAPNIVGIEPGFEMMLICKAVFLLVFWICDLPYKDHLCIKAGCPSKHTFSLHQRQVLFHVTFFLDP